MIKSYELSRRDIKEVHMPVLKAFDKLFSEYNHVLEEKVYGHKRIFPNGMRCDLLCHQSKRPAVFRINRGKRLVKQYPMLGLLIETLWVIGKIQIASVEDIETKNIKWLLEYVYQAPAWLRYNA